MIYILIIALLFIAELIYFRIADRYNIIDRPNERSSHTQITRRGGGVIFWVAATLYVVFKPTEWSLWFGAGITLMAGVSFLDDIKGVDPKTRLAVQLLAMTCAFFAVGVFGTYPWWAIILAYIFFIGSINAYNFMDGINGITGLYSIAVLLSLMWVNYYVQAFIDGDFLRYPFLALLVFLFFNFRKKAICFAGDIGSTSIAFWIVTALIVLIIKTQNLIWIGFLLVYGVDTVCTILHRIYLKQNIMKAHRLHFFQILANECKMPHQWVSVIYALVQLACSAAIIAFYPAMGWCIFGILALVLVAIYGLKFRLMKK
ncbi:MAG: UDP-GlcNAc--UDP-phosphate GlcNAc-1-phosphate transferase [Dysgonamonadaceae bacterium]|jgi:UDP-N-acetylmuramyl pentapeptide phosphotransferase/UDP-N-acetylglucosamine-1-phosphate transferase|nr:UDP-GlcNAc--UDP-phosphate GlcNAc-1-phosphate transferase [Dysgonamonadaceae bacterium]